MDSIFIYAIICIGIYLYACAEVSEKAKKLGLRGNKIFVISIIGTPILGTLFIIIDLLNNKNEVE